LIEQALLRRQMAYQLIGGFRFYLRKEIKDLVAYLLLINNPADDIALVRAINAPTRGIGKKTIETLIELAARRRVSLLDACRMAVQSDSFAKRASSAIAGFLKIYDQLCTLSRGSLLELIQATIDLTQYRDFLTKSAASETDAHELSVNLDELLAEANELDQDGDEDRPALEVFLEYAALQSDTDRLKTDSDMVTVMTLHAAKGLEFPIVFVIAVEENILPHARTKEDPLAIEEERRLLFVGITRAKDHLQLSCAKSRGFGNQGSGVPSSFLMELPRGEMAVLDHTENLDEYYHGSSGFGDDEFNQSEKFDDFGDSSMDFDDACQLPAEELKKRLAKLGKRVKLGSQITDVMSDSETGIRDWSAFKPNCVVTHPQFGSGRITEASGNGPKRAVTVEFYSDGSRRTFRLSHVQLTLDQED
jgi:DNA helicase-2/ATP-dependent DNA helicase PcrA